MSLSQGSWGPKSPCLWGMIHPVLSFALLIETRKTFGRAGKLLQQILLWQIQINMLPTLYKFHTTENQTNMNFNLSRSPGVTNVAIGLPVTYCMI